MSCRGCGIEGHDNLCPFCLGDADAYMHELAPFFGIPASLSGYVVRELQEGNEEVLHVLTPSGRIGYYRADPSYIEGPHLSSLGVE